MTAADVDALDAARARLAAALNGAGSLGCEEFDPNDLDSGCPDCEDLLRAVDALLPVVQAVVAERAAAELRAAADWLNGDGDGPAAPEWPGALPRTDVAAMLHGWADEFAELGCPDCESPFHGRPCPRAALAQPTGLPS